MIIIGELHIRSPKEVVLQNTVPVYLVQYAVPVYIHKTPWRVLLRKLVGLNDCHLEILPPEYLALNGIFQLPDIFLKDKPFCTQINANMIMLMIRTYFCNLSVI